MLSEQAKQALVKAGSSRQGAKVHGPDAVIAELRGQEMIGPELGLTRHGSITRERLVEHALNSAFG